MKKVYITTAIPYVNGNPHIGHVMDYLLADVCARYHRLLGDEVKLQVGTDEHGGKIAQKADSLGIEVQKYVDGNAEVFRKFIDGLGVDYTDFIRTTDAEHVKRCQEIWRRLSDHIYKAEYEGWYCAGCERFVTQKEYDENKGVCPDHLKPYEKLKEENYYLRIADFKDRIMQAIEAGEMVILPEFRKRDVLKLLAETPDVSVSRPVSQLKWGVPVPGDESQTMYVWIDALSNYLTVLGYPDNEISDWWPAEAQFVGKDILRFHAIIWPAMLLGLGLPLPRNIISHGFVLADGVKMSKSIGNVVDPMEVLNKYGLDGMRYYFLRHIDTFNDADFTWDRYVEAYSNELANDLGNLVQRLAVLASKNGIESIGNVDEVEMDGEYKRLMDNYEYAKAFDFVWEKVQEINKNIDEEKPWLLAKNGDTAKLERCLKTLIGKLLDTNKMLKPFLPDTASKIEVIFSSPITPPEVPLFPKDFNL